jgi:hypothetical protein
MLDNAIGGNLPKKIEKFLERLWTVSVNDSVAESAHTITLQDDVKSKNK